MTGTGDRDPIEAWGDLSARAATATSPRAASRTGVPVVDARRSTTFAGAGVLMLAAVVVAVALAIRPTPGPSATDAVRASGASASASASASADTGPSPSAVVSSTADAAFRFTLTIPASHYTTVDEIDPVTTVTWIGPDPNLNVFHAASPVVFRIQEVGGARVMEGGSDLPCLSTVFASGAPKSYPFEKSGSPTDDPTAGFDSTWYAERGLRLPAGQWLISAELDVTLGGCAADAERHHLRTSAEVTVVPATLGADRVVAAKDDGTFRLTLTTPRGVYGPNDAIEPVATISYLGPDAETTIFHGGSPILFSLEELGGGRRMDGSMTLPCIHTRIDQAEPLTFPFVKSGIVPGSFDRAWFDDPDLRLPVGTWRIRAQLIVETSDGTDTCGGISHGLTADIVVQVVATGPLPSEAVESTPTIDPSVLIPTDGPAQSSTSDDLFDLRLSAPKAWYTPSEAIEPFALLRYRGPDGKVTVGHADPYLTFTIQQLDGDAQMTGGAADSCTVTTFTRDAAVVIPFHKAGQLGLRFDEAWFRDPVLRLPVGKWRITAMFEGGIPACEAGGEIHGLTTSIDITVVAGP